MNYTTQCLYLFTAPLFCITLSSPAQHNPFQPPTETYTTTTTPTTQLQAFHLHYLTTQSLIKILSAKKQPWLSPNAKISTIENNHSIWIQDQPKALKKITQLLASIDHPSPQIHIKAEIISLNHHISKSLGTQFNTQPQQNQNTTASNTINNLLIPLFTLSNNTQINLQLQALIQHGKAKLLANPELITLNQQAATIESGQEIPYPQATSNGATSITFKEAALKLTVTPQLMPKHNILLHIQLNQDSVSTLKIAGVPAISTQHVNTTVRLKNHQTIVLGGILTSQKSEQKYSVPLLNHIPLLGRLFKDKHTNQTRNELMILITPDAN